MRDRRDRPGDEYRPDDRAAADYGPEGQYATYGQGAARGASPAGRGGFPGGPAARAGARTRPGQAPGTAPPEGPVDRPYRGSGPGGARGGRPARNAAGTRRRSLPVPESGLPSGATRAAGSPAAATGAAGSPAAAAARPYGRILIFTLLDDRVADFDRLAEETAEYVRTGEPDTLVYVIHLVPNAPLQRIFYEIYRDRAAFDSHESQPYMQRFVAERRTCVLATNVIELRLKYAKVAPLPGPPSAPLPVGPAAPLPVGGPRPAPGAPAPQRARPLPPSRPQRPDQPGYGQAGSVNPDTARPARPAWARPARVRPAGYASAPTGSATTSGGPTRGRFRRACRTAASVTRITLLGRPGCHLCDDARAVIERVAADLGVGWEERDITASPDDMREYWDKIPVTLVDGVQIDFWRVSEARLRAALG